MDSVSFNLILIHVMHKLSSLSLQILMNSVSFDLVLVHVIYKLSKFSAGPFMTLSGF